MNHEPSNYPPNVDLVAIGVEEGEDLPEDRRASQDAYHWRVIKKIKITHDNNMFFQNPRIKKMHKRNNTELYKMYTLLVKCLVVLFIVVLALALAIANIQEASGKGAHTEAVDHFQDVPEMAVASSSVSHETEAELEKVERPYYTLIAHVTGYNTVPEQTDSTPCISASGDNICGRTDVVTCSREIPLGTEIEIDGKIYVCLDRTARKYDKRFDISCDKDMQCPYEVTGYKKVKVFTD